MNTSTVAPEACEQLRPTAARYIKLGEAGKWERECIKRGIVRFGLGNSVAETTERLPLCSAGRWDELRNSFINGGKSQGTATRFVNETRLFFGDAGTMLWVTFVGEFLYWGFLDPATSPRLHPDSDSVFRNVSGGGWRCTDLAGRELTKDKLSGALTRTAAYRGTSCRVDKVDYLVGRINCQTAEDVEKAIGALQQLKSCMVKLMKLLQPEDFEILVDLVFSASGWRRLGRVGGAQKTLDLDLMLPTTGERVFVQVKSEGTLADLTEYANTIGDDSPYERMFYVHHSEAIDIADDRVVQIDCEKLAGLVVNAGLADWLIAKVS